MAKKDFYSVLGVAKSASDAEIKSAYRKLARKHHPDIDKSAGSAEKFKEISEAYQILSDPQKRKTYDQFGSDAFAPGQGRAGAYGNPFGGAQGGPFGNGGFSYSWSSNGNNSQDFVDPFDLFEQIFGGGFGEQFAQGFRRRQSYQLDLTFDEAMKGVSKNIEIERLEGNSNKRIREGMAIKVPAGVNSGTRMRYGDIDIVFRVKPHPELQREGDDIYTEFRLSVPQIVLGEVIEVNTVNGKLKLKVPAGSEPNSLIRIQGKGAPTLRGGRGDHYVKIKLDVPKHLSHEERKLYEDLKVVHSSKKKSWF